MDIEKGYFLMIYPLQNTEQPVSRQVQSPEKKGFFMQSGRNDRMGGSIPVWEKIAASGDAIPAGQVAEFAGKEGAKKATGDDSFDFFDFLDIINPLQHIPLVSSLYRHITGDEIGPAAKIVGGGLYGGPLGAAVGMASAAISQETGKETGEALLDMFKPSGSGLDVMDSAVLAHADLSKPRYNE